MKKYILVILLPFLVPKNAFAQNSIQKLFAGYDVDNAVQIAKTKDSNYVVLGHTHSFGSGEYDIVLMKINTNGKTIWNKVIGTNKSESGINLRECPDGGFIILAANVVTNSLRYFLLVRTDKNGNTQWAKIYDGVNSGTQNHPHSVNLSKDGGYIICGRSGGRAAVLKIDKDGNQLWAKGYVPTGSIGDAWGAKETKTGNIIFYGDTENGVPLITMLDPIGNIIWQKNLNNNIPFQGPVNENSLIELSDGTFVFTVFTNIADIRLYFINLSGIVTKSIIYSGGDVDYPLGINQTADSGFIMTGYTKSIGAGSGHTFLMKLNRSGVSEWVTFFGSGEWAFYPQEAIGGGYIFTGNLTPECGLSKSDIFVMTTDGKGLNDCMGYYGNLQKIDTTTIVGSPNFNVNNVNFTVTPVDVFTQDFTFMESNICRTLDVKKAYSYPNPFIDETTLRIEFDGADKICPSFIGARLLYLTIYDAAGRLIRKEEITNAIANLTTRIEFKIQRKTLASGLYVWELSDKFGTRIGSGKMIAIQ